MRYLNHVLYTHIYVHRMERCLYKHVMEPDAKDLVHELRFKHKEPREGDKDAKQCIDRKVKLAVAKPAVPKECMRRNFAASGHTRKNLCVHGHVIGLPVRR